MSDGYRKFLKNIIPRIARHSDVEALLCAAPQFVNIQSWIDKLPHVEIVNCMPFRPFRYTADSKLYNELNNFSPDVIFIPVERYFKYKGIPVVNMVQNMGPLVFPDTNNHLIERVRNLVQAIESKIAVKKAVRIIAVSNFVREFLVKKWNITADHINVIYYGCDLPEGSNIISKKPDLIPENWKGKFLFTAGSINTLRGLEDLLMAIKRLCSEKIDISGLVIAGEVPPNMLTYQKKLMDWVKTNALSSRIIWLGHLNESEMSWGYSYCSAFVMTSRVESFGNIAVEAMAHGCISIAADNPCLPEIFDHAAVYYPPKNWKALAEAIQHVHSWDNDKRNKVIEGSKKRASEFSWNVCADKIVSELANAAKVLM
jgi:glycosyltransferase involved in cell wall biosynthesis